MNNANKVSQLNEFFVIDKAESTKGHIAKIYSLIENSSLDKAQKNEIVKPINDALEELDDIQDVYLVDQICN